MIHSIQNSFLSISVKQTGAELSSIVDIASKQEFIWQAVPSIWANHAPNLFPIVGALKDNKYLFEGIEYQLPKHGFIRYNSDIKLISSSNQHLSFSLSTSDKTLQMYPFHFEYIITYRLDEKTLHITQEVLNLDSKELFFSLGGHPAFNCPLHESEAYEDYHLCFEQEESFDSHTLTSDGLLSEKTITIAQKSHKLQLHQHLFDNDALIFTQLKSKSVSLNTQERKILSVDFTDFPYLGIWAKPNAPYVCIEPWQGITDTWDHDFNLKHKKGILSLLPEAKHIATYSITIA